MPARPAFRRACRRAALAAAAPALGGFLIAVAVLAGRPVEGPWRWTSSALLLAPAVLVHCHDRAETHGFGIAQTAAVSVAAGLVAYAVGAVGLAAGAALTVAIVVAAQTGVLAVAAQLAGLLSFALAVSGRGRRAV